MKAAIKKMHLAMVTAAVAFAAFATFAEEATAKSDKPAEAKATKSEAKKTAKADENYKPLAEARAKIGDIISDPSLMAEVIKDLSPDDQKTFLADVNAGIAKLPGSTEDKTAKYLNVNRAALKGVSSTAMTGILATTFSTVPPESLTVISERYAVDLFNRDADPSHKMSDSTFERTATEILGTIEKATAGSDDEGVRNTLAILMLTKADNGKIPELTDRLIATMPDATSRELAQKEWIPAATAKEGEKSYEAMLAYADAGKAPNLDIVLNLAGPQILDAVIVDIASAMDNAKGIETTPVMDQNFGGFDEARAYYMLEDTTSASAAINGGGAVPRTTDPTKPWNPAYKRGDQKPYSFSNL